MWISFLKIIIRHTRNVYGIIQVRTHNYNLYILEQPSSWSTSRIRPSWPPSRLRLSLLLVSLSECISCYHVQPSILLLILTDRFSHLTPSLLSGWLLTDIQVNNLTTLHNTHGHIYIHHIGITILLPSYTSSTLLGLPAGTDPSHLIQWGYTYTV
jgi:hypothetical protein